MKFFTFFIPDRTSPLAHSHPLLGHTKRRIQDVQLPFLYLLPRPHAHTTKWRRFHCTHKSVKCLRFAWISFSFSSCCGSFWLLLAALAPSRCFWPYSVRFASFCFFPLACAFVLFLLLHLVCCSPIRAE